MNSIQAQVRGQAGWLRIKRPEAMNSMTLDMLLAIHEQVVRWGDDPAVKVIVLTGSGTVFCAGADLKSVLAWLHDEDSAGPWPMLEAAARTCRALRLSPKPVIAAVNGLAMGGGLELVLACDLVIACRSARMADAHAKHGVFPAAGGAALLARKIPANLAKWLLFTGEPLGAEELHRAGLVNAVVDDAELEAFAQQAAEGIAARSPSVLRRMKEVADAACEHSAEDALRHEWMHLQAHLRTNDFREGVRAFSERRAPVFTGD